MILFLTTFDKLGEFVEAGEHGGRPYYRQRDFEGTEDIFLYSDGRKWFVTHTLGASIGGLRNYQDSPQPPFNQWINYDGKTYNNDDASLTLEFTTLSP